MYEGNVGDFFLTLVFYCRLTGSSAPLLFSNLLTVSLSDQEDTDNMCCQQAIQAKPHV